MAKFLAYTLSFAVLIAGVVSWLSPHLLEWYATPAVDIGINCGPTAKWAMERMLYTQIAGFLFGFVFGMLFWVTRSSSRKNPEPSASPSQS